MDDYFLDWQALYRRKQMKIKKGTIILFMIFAVIFLIAWYSCHPFH